MLITTVCDCLPGCPAVQVQGGWAGNQPGGNRGRGERGRSAAPPLHPGHTAGRTRRPQRAAAQWRRTAGGGTG